MKVSEAVAFELAATLLLARGTPQSHAEMQAAVLIDAELKGHPSHGLQRLPRLLARIEGGLIDPTARGRLEWKSQAWLYADGLDGLGPVITFAALDALRGRVGSTGIALATVRNSNHLGMLAYYVEQLAALGLTCIALSSSEALVHPFGGTKALLGTNPVAIGVPVGDQPPLVVDLATSKVSMGKVHHYASTGQPLEPGWAKDAAGRDTTDAAAARLGSIAPFGEAKGYALGLALELLIAGTADSALAPEIGGTLDAEKPCNKGDVFIVIDTAASTSLKDRLGAYLDVVRACPAEDASRPVAVPGDGARRRKAQARQFGFEVDERLLDTLTSMLPQSSSNQRALTL